MHAFTTLALGAAAAAAAVTDVWVPPAREYRGPAPAPTWIPASDPRLTYLGRTRTNEDGSRTLDWEATSILVTLANATFLAARVAPNAPAGAPDARAARTKLITDIVHSSLEAEHNFSQGFAASELWVDGVAGAYSNDTYVVAEGLESGESYTVRIFNAPEPLFHGTNANGSTGGYGAGTFTFFGLLLDGVVLAPAPRAPRSLEWVGDSLTAGFGSRGVRPPCETSQLSSSNYYSYSRYVGDALGAATTVIAWSGKGMKVNCCDEGANMTTLYLQTLGNDPTAMWDFDTATPPSALLINLLSNDMSKLPSNGTAAFLRGLVDAFEFFILRATRDLYKVPDLPVLLVQGPVNHTTIFDVLQTVHDELRAAGVNVHRVSAVVNMSMDGCSAHPGTEAHKAMAAVLLPQVRSILGW